MISFVHFPVCQFHYHSLLAPRELFPLLYIKGTGADHAPVAYELFQFNLTVFTFCSWPGWVSGGNNIQRYIQRLAKHYIRQGQFCRWLESASAFAASLPKVPPPPPKGVFALFALHILDHKQLFALQTKPVTVYTVHFLAWWSGIPVIFENMLYFFYF